MVYLLYGIFLRISAIIALIVFFDKLIAIFYKNKKIIWINLTLIDIVFISSWSIILTSLIAPSEDSWVSEIIRRDYYSSAQYLRYFLGILNLYSLIIVLFTVHYIKYLTKKFQQSKVQILT
jgi:hypothetical protein